MAIYRCQPDIKYKDNKDLIGNWKGITVEIVSPSNEHINFAVDNYGYSNLSISRDSTYTFVLKFSKDVVLKKEVFEGSNSFGSIYYKKTKIVGNAGLNN